MDFPVKVAVATKEGKAVSEHFGHATRFAIYEVTPESVCLLEEHEVSHYCLGGEPIDEALLAYARRLAE